MANNEENTLILDLEKYNELLHSDSYFDLLEEMKEKIINEPEKRMEPYIDNIPLSNYFTLLILGKPFQDLKIEFTEEYLVNPVNINEYYEYFDKIIDSFIKKGIEINRINENIAFIIDELTIFANKYILKMDGPSISLYDIFRLANENPEIDRLINFTKKDIDKDLTYQEIINKVQNPNMHKLIEEINKDKMNDYKTFLMSGTGINKIQLNEGLSFIGYKPDIRGNVDTNIMDTSFVRGLKTTAQHYTDSEASLNASNNSKNKVRESGYLNRQISLVTADIMLDKNTLDCGSKYYLTVDVNNEETLKLITDRYHLNENGELEIINYAKHKHLIGTKVKLRSPITCACDNGKVCKTCYGEKLYYTNLEKNIGILATLLLTEPMTQKLLSTKHLLAVVIKDFDWSQEFLDNFEFKGDKIIPRDPKTKILIDEMKINEDIDYGRYKTEKFIAKIGTKKFKIESPVILNIPDKNIDTIENHFNEKEKKFELSLKDLNEEHFFEIKIKNEGIADPLLRIRATLERSDIIKNKYENRDYEQMFNDIKDLLLDSGTKIMLVHLEVIMRNLIFLNGEFKDRVRYSEDDFNPEIKLLNVKSAILNLPSPVQSLIFENIKAQLSTEETNGFFSKKAESLFDPLFDFNI